MGGPTTANINTHRNPMRKFRASATEEDDAEDEELIDGGTSARACFDDFFFFSSGIATTIRLSTER
jgi:hypothetical protein